MESVTPFDLQRFFWGSQPPLYILEILVRVVLIYGFATLALRYMGKRGKREMSPFEYLVIVALGSATGDAMFYPEVPILHAWLVIIMVIALNRSAAVLQLRSRRVNVFLEGVPRLLIRNGEIKEDCVRQENLRFDEFLQLLRSEGISHTSQVRYAFLEPTGDLSVFRAREEDNFAGSSTFPRDFEEED